MPVYDFSSGLNLLNQGISTLGDALGNRTDAQAYAQIGDSLAKGDYQGAAARAWQAGKPDIALKLQNQAMLMGAGTGAYPTEAGGGGGGGGGGGAAAAPDGSAAKPAALTPPAAVGKGVGQGYAASGYSKADVAGMIRDEASARGIDPDVALKVAQSEGLNSYVGDQGRSFGPYQLFTGGGLGNVFKQQTGLDPSDPTTVRQQIQFALDHAATNGWGSWYGARNTGIANNAGLSGAHPIGVGRPGVAGGPSAAGPTSVVSSATPGEAAGPTLPAPGSVTPDAQPAAAAQPTPTQGSLGASMLTATKALQSGQVTLQQLQQNFAKYGLPDPANPASQPVWANLGKVAAAGRGSVGALNLPTVPGPQGGAVAAALPPSAGPAPGTPGPGKPGELGTPVPGPAAPPPAAAPPPTDLTEVGGTPGAVTPTSQQQVRQMIPGLIPEQGGFGDQPPRPAAAQPDFTDPLTGLRMPSPPNRPTAPTPPVPGGPPGYSAARTGAGAAAEADPRAVAGVARDVPAVHTPAAVPAKLQPSSSSSTGSTDVQGPAGPAPRRPSQAEERRFLGPAASNAAADFGVAPSAIRAAPQAQAPLPPPGSGMAGPYGGPGGLPPQAGAPPQPGGGNPITALLSRLGVGPQPGPGAQPAAMPGPGGQPPPPPQGGAPGGGAGPLQSLLGGLLNMGSMQPPGGVPGLPTPAQQLGVGPRAPMPGQPGFGGAAPPALAGGGGAQPAALAPGGPAAGPGGAPGAGAGAPPTLPQVKQQASAAVAQGSQFTDIPTLTRLRDQQRMLAQRMAIFSPEMAKPLEESANHLDDRINDLIKQQQGATIKSGEIGEQARSTQANESIKNLGTDYGKLTSATGPESLIRNVNEMEGEIGKSAVGFGTAQGAMEHILGTLAPFDPSIAAIAGNTQLLKGRANIELAQMANQLYPTRLNRVEFNALRDGTLDLSTRPDVLFDLLEMSKQRAISLVDQHNKSVDRTADAFSQYGGKEAKTMYHVDLPDELRAPGDRDAALGKPKAPTGGKAPPKVGAIEDGHRFTGGDPANPASWEVVK